jgi:hypothetical protein
LHCAGEFYKLSAAGVARGASSVGESFSSSVRAMRLFLNADARRDAEPLRPFIAEGAGSFGSIAGFFVKAVAQVSQLRVENGEKLLCPAGRPNSSL